MKDLPRCEVVFRLKSNVCNMCLDKLTQKEAD